MVVFLFAVAEAVEVLSLERARHAIKSLTALAPETAEVKTDTGWLEQPEAIVDVGACIRVCTGSRVPLAARVDSGHAALNQEFTTGWIRPWDHHVAHLILAVIIVHSGFATRRR